MQERRKYARLNIPLEVSCLLNGEGGLQCKTVTKDISPNGARLSIDKELTPGSTLDLEVKIPVKEEPIPIKAKVVWSKKDATSAADKDAYDAGLEFVQIPDDSKNAFFQYLCNLMYDQLKRIK